MASSPSPLPAAAVVAGRYVIQSRLGSGGTGTVYLADDRATGRRVALKVIRAERFLAGAVDRMHEEFRAIASLHHPQIAAAYDFGYMESTGLPFYTREYVHGTPLPPGPPVGTAPR